VKILSITRKVPKVHFYHTDNSVNKSEPMDNSKYNVLPFTHISKYPKMVNMSTIIAATIVNV